MPENFDDYLVDDILKPKGKKRLNSKKKGNRAELELCKLLNSFFNVSGFSRTLGSGFRWSHVKQVSKDYVGDLVVEPGWRFSMEAKNGYPDIDLARALEKGDKQLDEFLKQADLDADRSKRLPMLCWKRDRSPWLVFIKERIDLTNYPIYLNYKGWVGVSINNLLKTEQRSFFFENTP